MATSQIPLRDILQRFTRKGELYRVLDDNLIECYACGHRCKIRDGRDGICHIRFNRGGELRVPHGYVAGLQVDPIEKKPFFHAFPGSKALSFGMLGCDLHCAYCQNWITSQALLDPAAGSNPMTVTPQQIVDLAKSQKARVLTSTYNEPLITSEWAIDIFRLGKSAGMTCSYVSNGNATPEVIEFIRPFVDLYKIDLKSFNDRNYRKLGTTLHNVTDSIAAIAASGFWLEVVTLVVPGFNDSDTELTELASFLCSVSRNIPWHVTAFHPDYKMQDTPGTPPETLLRAAAIGRQAGLHFVYAGNLPGRLHDLENTFCHQCGTRLVERAGFTVKSCRLVDGKCPACHTIIPGLWS